MQRTLVSAIPRVVKSSDWRRTPKICLPLPMLQTWRPAWANFLSMLICAPKISKMLLKSCPANFCLWIWFSTLGFMQWASLYQVHIKLDFWSNKSVSWFLFCQWPAIAQNPPFSGVCEVSVRCLEGVWKVSERCLDGVWWVSGRCLMDNNAKSIDKNPQIILLISWSIFSQWPPIGRNRPKLEKVIWPVAGFFFWKKLYSVLDKKSCIGP